MCPFAALSSQFGLVAQQCSDSLCAVLITGVGPNGLGATLAESLASQSPALLILSGRTLSKVEITSQDVATKYPSVKIRLLKLDLASFDSVDAAAAEVNAYPETSIDVLINNAGVMNIPERTLSTDGVEMHLMVNYLGAFCFTNSVMGKLLSRGGRIVNVGSNGYALSPFRFADYNFADKPLPESEQPPKALCKAFGIPWGLGYLPEIAYGQSKTAMMLYSVQLCHLLHAKGVTAVTANPGGKRLPSVEKKSWSRSTDELDSDRNRSLATYAQRGYQRSLRRVPDEKQVPRSKHDAGCCS